MGSTFAMVGAVVFTASYAWAQVEDRRDYGQEAIDLIRSHQPGAETEPNQWALYGWVCSEGASLAEMFEEHDDAAVAFAEQHPDLYIWNEIIAGGDDPTYPELRTAWERFESGIEGNSRFFDRLHSLAQSNRLVPPKPERSLLENSYPMLNQSRATAQMLKVRMQLQLLRNDLDGSVETYESLFGLGLANHAVGGMGHYLAGSSICLWAYKEAMNTCYAGVLDNDHLQRLMDTTLQFSIPSAELGLEYERLTLLEANDDFYLSFSEGGKNGIAGAEQLVRLATGIASHREATAVANRYYDAMRDSLYSSGKMREQADSILGRIEDESWRDKFKILTLMSMSVELIRTRETTLSVMRDGTIAMLALELHRLRKGDYPASLDELVPEFLVELPIDPFTNNPLRYRLTDASADYVLYSTGTDKTDDGGEPYPGSVFRPLQGNGEGYDFVINDPRLR